MEIEQLVQNPTNEILAKFACKSSCRIRQTIFANFAFLKSDCPNYKTCLRCVEGHEEPFSFCYLQAREYVAN